MPPMPERRFDGQPLAVLDALIPWEQFRPALAQALSGERRGIAEYRQLDPLLLFKALMLKGFYGLTDLHLACQIADRHSFQRFVGLPVSPAGDLDVHAFSRGVSAFLEILRWQGLIYPLFDRFHEILEEAGVRIEKGQMRDIEIVPWPD